MDIVLDYGVHWLGTRMCTGYLGYMDVYQVQCMWYIHCYSCGLHGMCTTGARMRHGLSTGVYGVHGRSVGGLDGPRAAMAHNLQ